MQRLVLAALAIALAAGCKPKVGRKCSPEGKEVCAGKSAALVCEDGKWAPMACRGGKGCSGEGAAVLCDQSIARDKDACQLESAVTCAEDKRSTLECKNDAWTPSETCGGPQGCTRTAAGGAAASCDSSLAKEGDKCTHAGSQACSQDKRSRLACTAGHYALAEYCRGTDGCKVAGRVVCDNSLAVLGEPCDIADNVACSTDFRTILVCREGKYAADTKCSATTSCRVEGTKVGCLQ